MSSQIVKLGDVCEIDSGFAFDSTKFGKELGIPLIRIRDIMRGHTETLFNGNYDKKYIVNNGDILIGMDGEFNVAKWGGGEALLNQRVCRIYSKLNKISEQYLLHFLPKQLKKIEDATPFVTVKHLSVKTIKDIGIALPPLEEQKRIAEILDKANEIKAKREQALAKLDHLAKSIFEDSITKVKKSGDYSEVTLNEIAIFYAGNSLPLGMEFLEQKNGYFLMKVSDMNIDGNERYIFRCKEWSSFKGSKSGTCPENSIVIPKRGGAIGTNKKRITTRETILDPNLMAIKAKENLVMTEYLMQWFLNFDLKTITSGSSVPQLNKKDLVPLKVLLPNLHEQLRFANAIKNIENTKKKINLSLETISNLLVSLQNQAFTTGFNA